MTRRELCRVLQWKEHCPEGPETQVLVPSQPQTSHRALSSSQSLPWACFFICKIGAARPTLEAYRDVGEGFSESASSLSETTSAIQTGELLDWGRVNLKCRISGLL